MSEILKNVDSRTNLVGQNRLELLMFQLMGRQTFAINVFKVQEVLTLPKLTLMPQRHPAVIGVVYLRGRALPVIDLSCAIGMRPLDYTKESTIIVTEYNSTVQAFLVSAVDRIVNLNWEQIKPPPTGAGRHHYLTAITQLDDQIIEVVDVEKVLSEIAPLSTDLPEELLQDEVIQKAKGMAVLIVDDSQTAHAQVQSTFERMGLTVHQAYDGLEGLEFLQKMSDDVGAGKVSDRLLLVVTDAEMPRMDGYRLTTEIRQDPRLQDLFVVLHTSLSGAFNEAMVQKVGCDRFLSKFKPEELAYVVRGRIETMNNE
jgi:two-component system, chemotaxis family, chemotaxis protein CheV